jgi:hypothetical protein
MSKFGANNFGTKETVKVYIYEDGTVEIDTIGFKGKACEDIGKKIDAALKAKGKTTKIKPEYYEGKDGTKRTLHRG